MMRRNQRSSERSNPNKSRSRPVSCYFCRSRKLRCSRVFPCSNCATRGISCELYATSRGCSSGPPVPAVQDASVASQSELLERLRRLEELLVSQTQSQSQSGNAPPRFGIFEEQLRLPAPAQPQPCTPRGLQHLTADVPWLERLCLGQNFLDAICPEGLVFRICRAQQILKSAPYIHQRTFGPDSAGDHIKCVWLPHYEEARVFLEKYVNDITYLHHVVHISSLRAVVDQLYVDLARQTQVKPGHVALLLSIFASATYSWTPLDCEGALFSSSVEANSQTPSWIKATQDVLDYSQRTTCVSLEGIQAVIIVSFVICNLEGISQRYRSLISTAIVMCREIGLHRQDHPDSTTRANTVQAEIGRRVWWYLVATDWMLSRYAGPSEGVYSSDLRHMAINKPLNANDEDLVDGMGDIGQPVSQPTDMSYFLQRVRLAEICRDYTDRTPATSNPIYSDVMDTDAKLNNFMDEIPSFFRINGDLVELAQISPRRVSGIIVQRYFINSLIHTQRCKLHLPYLAQGSVEPTYSYSRQTCLNSARLVIQTELQLERECLPFVHTRLKLSGVLYGVFMASIVLLLNMCLDRAAGQQEARRVELVEAFRILEDARTQSVTAAKLLDSLIAVLQKNKVSPAMWQSESESEERNGQPSTVTIPGNSAPTMQQLTVDLAGMASNGGYSILGQSFPKNQASPSSFDDMSGRFEGRMVIDAFDWNGFFSGLDSSFI